MESVWYYAHGGAQTGPVSFGDLRAAVASGQLGPEDLVWKEGTVDWVPARSIAGLFPSVVPAVPPPARPPAPPRAPAPAAPMRSSARGPAEPLPLGEPLPAAGGPTGPGNEYVELAKEFLRRTAAADPTTIAPTPEEDQKLTQAGYDPVVKKYVVWRRAVLWVAIVPTAFAALFALIDLLAMEEAEKANFSAFGTLLLFVQVFALFTLPFGAAFAALAYDNMAKSSRLVLIAGLISLGVPLLIAFMPANLLLDQRPAQGEPAKDFEQRKQLTAALLGIYFYLVLMPLILSLLPAVSRACVRMKGFLPESLVPGWGLVASIPVFVLLTLAAFTVIYHVASNILFLLGLILWIGAPLLYLSRFKLLTRPVTESQDIQALAKTQLYVLGTMVAGIVLIIIYMMGARVMDKPLLGTGKDAIWRPWSLEPHRIWIEYLGRSLFLTVLFADLLVRMAVMVWREDRAFAGTGPAANFDRTMSGFGEAVETKGLPPVT